MGGWLGWDLGILVLLPSYWILTNSHCCWFSRGLLVVLCDPWVEQLNRWKILFVYIAAIFWAILSHINLGRKIIKWTGWFCCCSYRQSNHNFTFSSQYRAAFCTLLLNKYFVWKKSYSISVFILFSLTSDFSTAHIWVPTI